MDSGKKSSSSSSSSRSKYSYGYTYDVFLSSVVRYRWFEFGEFLYRALLDAGLRVYREDDEIKRRADLGKVIRESKVALILVSRDSVDYTDWLDEVAILMSHRAAEMVQVLAVFYYGPPSDIRASGGTHEKSFKTKELDNLREIPPVASHSPFKASLWKYAQLQQAAGLANSQHQGDRTVSQFVRDVVVDARRLANLVMLDIPSHLVGQPYRFSGLKRWMQDLSHEKSIALLHGTCGIGKKTIAAVVSNQSYHDFDATAFLQDVAEKSKMPLGIVFLQQQLLSRLEPRKQEGKKGIKSVEEGMLSIKASLQDKRVLIMLADLDHTEQFYKFIGEPENLRKGSKVIVTSRDPNLLQDNLCVKFAVGSLTPAQSLELFSLHAFGKSETPREYKAPVLAALRPYVGNPLAIKAYASLFTSLGKAYWDELLHGTNEDIKSSTYQRDDLRARFDSLEQIDKKLFLDIACFYVGGDRDYVDLVLNNGILYDEGGFDRLRRKHLVSVDTNNIVTMSEPVIDMAREIVRKKFQSEGKWSNIWSPEEAIKILREHGGTEDIRSFILDGSRVGEGEMEFETEAFAGMTKLKLLQLVNVKLKGDFKDFPQELVCFCWDGMSLHRMPDSNSLEDMSFEKLKILDLSCSSMLERTPDFGRLRVPNLESLILEGCSGLVEIHPSIQDLTSLVLLSLKGCGSLQELSVVGSPIILDISGCPALRVMPNTRIESVKELRADQIDVNQLLAESADLSLSAVFPRLVKSSILLLPSDVETTVRHVSTDLGPRRNPVISWREYSITSYLSTLPSFIASYFLVLGFFLFV